MVASRRAWLQQPGNPAQQIEGVKGGRSLQLYFSSFSLKAVEFLCTKAPIPSTGGISSQLHYSFTGFTLNNFISFNM